MKYLNLVLFLSLFLFTSLGVSATEDTEPSSEAERLYLVEELVEVYPELNRTEANGEISLMSLRPPRRPHYRLPPPHFRPNLPRRHFNWSRNWPYPVHFGFVCYTQNLRGQFFWGSSVWPAQAQNNANYACQMSSYRCFVRGCEQRYF